MFLLLNEIFNCFLFKSSSHLLKSVETKVTLKTKSENLLHVNQERLSVILYQQIINDYFITKINKLVINHH